MVQYVYAYVVWCLDCVGGIILTILILPHTSYLIYYKYYACLRKVSPHYITVVLANNAFSAQHYLMKLFLNKYMTTLVLSVRMSQPDENEFSSYASS